MSVPVAPGARAPRLLAALVALPVLAPALGAQEPEPPGPDTVRTGDEAQAAADTVEDGDAAPDAARDTLEPVPPPEGVVEGTDLRVTVGRSHAGLSGLPLSVSVVDAASAEAVERRTSLEEALQGVPGVQVSNRRNFSLGDRLVVRGVGARAQFGVRGVQVLVDGIPLTLPDGQTSLTNLDLGSAERIEVLRGPASALYGNAAGGVIRVRTGGFARDGPEWGGRATVGADGFFSQEARAAGRAAGMDWLFHGAHLETDGFRDHAAAETWRANLVGRRLLGEEGGAGELRAVLNLFHMPFGQNPSSLVATTAREAPRTARDFIVSQGAGESATQGQAGVTLDRDLGRLRLRATGWGAIRDVWNPIPNRVIELDRLAGGVRAQVEGPGPGLPGSTWAAGLDASVQRDDRREHVNRGVSGSGGRAREGAPLLDQREEVEFLAPFLRLEGEPAPGLRLTAAGRLDLYRFEASDRLPANGDDSGTRELAHFSPSAGVAWTPFRPLTLYANVATAFETPTTSEFSNRPDGGGGFNPELEPQTLRSLEVGARGSGGALAWQVAVYDVEVTDALVPFEGPGEEVFFRNAGEVSRQGAELHLSWRPFPTLGADLAYAYQDYRFEEFAPEGRDMSGNREPGVPPHRLHASAVQRLPGGLEARARFTWSDAFPVDDANSASDPSHRVVDLRLSWTGEVAGEEARAFLGLDNLFAERYNASVVPNAFGGRFFEPAPGRQLFGGIEVRL